MIIDDFGLQINTKIYYMKNICYDDEVEFTTSINRRLCSYRSSKAFIIRLERHEFVTMKIDT
jgi:hypothetical protein